jgi:hypothetical protein
MPLALLVFSLLAVLPGSVAAEGALPWFHTYNVPGGYAVGGVDLVPLSFKDGLRTRRILMGKQLPPNAEILAAFLYWETMWKGPDEELQALRRQVKFRGFPVSGIKSSTQPLTPGCRGIGDGERISIMRADVLHLLPLQMDENNKPTGRRLVNDSDLAANKLEPHTVTLPDSGIFNFAPQSAGASLLVIYQDPDLAAPLTSIVVYDGLHVQQPGDDTVLPIRGFVDAVDGAAARLTIIGGSGFANLSERVFLGSRRIDDGNPFPAGGLLTDRAWSNPTFDVPAKSWTPQFHSEFGEQVTARVTHTLPLLLYDCLSTGAVVFSTTTQDSDGDGLSDKLEQLSGLKNPAGLPYPDIHTMGARADQRDLFVEVNAMHSDGWDPEKSRQLPAPGRHDHMPSEAVLTDAANALLHPPAGRSPIYVHFDVGDRGYKSPADNPNLFVSGSLARGGEQIEERECDPEVSPTPCRFPGFRGVVSFPAGLQFLALAPVDENGLELPDPVGAKWCDTNDERDCRRRFDLNRDGIFHYLLYAHARGVRKSDLPCVDESGNPRDFPQGMTVCDPLDDNPEYTTPKSSSGVAELPGRFAVVSFGLWDPAIATEKVQAQTTLHELGHNLGLWHGGAPPVVTPRPLGRVRVDVRPNCVPYYWSVMNYFYQAEGIVGPDGVARALLSDRQGPDVDEKGPADGLFDVNTLPVRSGWFAPDVAGTSQNNQNLEPAKRHCDGTPLQPGELPMVRQHAPFNASTQLWTIDWRGDGVGGTLEQDVNFDGRTPAPLAGHNDWETLTPDRLGFGRGMFELSLGTGLDFGGLDFGGLDFGGLDFGGLDFGGLPYAGLDFGGLDFGGLVGGLDFGGLDFGGVAGGLDFGGLDFGGLDFGGLDFGGLDFGGLGQEDPFDPEVTFEIVTESIVPGGSSPPGGLVACVLGGTTGAPVCDQPTPGIGIAANTTIHRNRLNWTSSDLGAPPAYNAYRVWDPTGQAEAPTPTSPVDFVGDTPDTTIVDRGELPNGQRFIYWVRGRQEGQGPLQGGSLSNYAIVTAENVAPVANDDTGYTLPRGSSATFPSVLGNDTDVDSPPTSLRATLVAGPQNGTLVLNPDGTFTYTPAPLFSGTDTFTYQANNGVFTQGGSSVPMSPNSNTATVTIRVRRVNVQPSFTKGPDQVVNQNAGPQTVHNWAANITPGAGDESDQTVDFIVTNNKNVLFEVQPAIAANGTLTYTPKAHASGVATVTVQIHDNGGTADGGIDTSAPQTFTITINPVVLAAIKAQKTDVWFTTSASSSTKFDLKAEVLKNDTVIASGTLTNTTLGSGTTFAKALYKEIWVESSTVSFAPSDALRVRVSIRLSNVYGAPSSAATKLYYNVPTPPGNSSHLHAKNNSTDVKYYMIKSGGEGGLSLQKNGTVAGPTQVIDFPVTSKTAYTPIATWSVTGP